MNLKLERIMSSKSEVLEIIKQKGRTLDLSFADPKNHIKSKIFDAELNMISKLQLPLRSQVLSALEQKRIILGKSNTNIGSSLLFVFGTDGQNGVVKTVFVNMTKFVKNSRTVDPETGDYIDGVTLQGGWEVLWELLYSAYIALNADKVYKNNDITRLIKTYYTDAMAQITSYSAGNPGDGVKFRFITDYFFYNGSVPVVDLAEGVRFNVTTAKVLKEQYPNFFDAKKSLTLEDYCNIINSEFKTFKKPISPESYVASGITSLGDTGVYLLDNQVYLLAIMAAKAMVKRYNNILKGQSRIVQGGFMLKQIELSAGPFNGELLSILM